MRLESHAAAFTMAAVLAAYLSGPAGAASAPPAAIAGQSQAGEAVPAAEFASAIGQLGDLDYNVRTKAARTVRRAAAAQAVPRLIDAVSTAGDGYVRFRALVLLAGFNDPRARDLMIESLESPNDRLRGVAYAYFEEHPEAGLAASLLAKLDKEESEFVRPALLRALAALDSAPVRARLEKEVNSGLDFFRSIVIDALGTHRAAYAVASLIAIAELDGPLRDDAVMSLGRIGDKRALTTFAQLQRSGSREVQPTIAAAICLLGVNCDSHTRFLKETLQFAARNSGYQPLLRSAAGGLAEVALHGDTESLDTLFDLGIPSQDPERAPIALAVGEVALRSPKIMLEAVTRARDAKGMLSLLRDGFDMLEEDYAEERFYATVRRAYWAAAESSPGRAAAAALIGALDF